VGTADVPLLAERSFGKGRVVFLALDYATQPLAGWAGNAALWRDILRPMERIDFGRVFAELGLLDEAHPVVKVLRRPVLAFPSHMLLTLLLLGYGCGLGLLFWRMGKRQAGGYWVGVFGLVVMATAIAYTIFPEQGLRRSALLMELTTVEVLPDTNYAHTHGYLGLFSTRGGQYTLPLQPAATILRHTFSRGAGKAGEDIGLSGADAMTMSNIRLDPWALRVFSLESVAPATLHIEARRHARGMTLLVKNHGSLPVQGAVVVYQGRLFALGAIGAGEEIFEDLYTTVQPVENRQENAWQALFKLRPGTGEARLAYFQEVLLQHFFGEKRLDTQENPLVTGWILAPTTLPREASGLSVRGVTLVVSRVSL
jgi:hypothetical protein